MAATVSRGTGKGGMMKGHMNHDTGAFPSPQPELPSSQFGAHNGAMQGSFNEKRYYAYTAALARRALAEKAARGETVMHAPTGYRNIWTPEGKKTEIDPVLGPLVQEAFRLAANKRGSLERIIDELTPKGLVSRNGSRFYRSGLHKLLQNPFYLGLLPFRGQIYQGKHPALVSQKLFDQVQVRLRSRRWKPGKRQ